MPDQGEDVHTGSVRPDQGGDVAQAQFARSAGKDRRGLQRHAPDRENGRAAVN